MSKKSTKVKQGDPFTRWLVVGMVTLVVAVGVIFSITGQSAKTDKALASLDSIKVGSPIVSTIDDPKSAGISFNAGAPIKLDVFEDFQCPACKQFEDVNGEYLKELVTSGKAEVVFHPLSFLGPESVTAANAAYCAADEGYYLSLHEALYQVQSTSENSGFLSPETMIEIGKRIGITSPAFESCITNQSKLKQVQASADLMQVFKVTGTPTVFVNGKVLDSRTQLYSASGFRDAIAKG